MFYNSYRFSMNQFLCPCSYHVDFHIMASVEAALVIMQCTAADLKDITADDGLVDSVVKDVVITGVIQLINSMSIIVGNRWCSVRWD